MDERKKELIAISFGLLLCGSVFINAAYQTYFNNQEQTMEFKVFETQFLQYKDGPKTLVMTNGTGTFYFLGTWTGQLIEGHSYVVTYVHQAKPSRSHQDLIIVKWEEI